MGVVNPGLRTDQRWVWLVGFGVEFCTNPPPTKLEHLPAAPKWLVLVWPSHSFPANLLPDSGNCLHLKCELYGISVACNRQSFDISPACGIASSLRWPFRSHSPLTTGKPAAFNNRRIGAVGFRLTRHSQSSSTHRGRGATPEHETRWLHLDDDSYDEGHSGSELRPFLTPEISFCGFPRKWRHANGARPRLWGLRSAWG